jgi:predicted outer membrane repeat protein
VANSFWTEPIYVNCYFSGNTAFGGGASFNQNQAAPTFLACTFSMNSATNRGGAIASNIATTVTLANCILWGDDAPDGPEVSMSGAAGYPSIMTMSYCDVEGGRSGIDVGPVASLEWGDGNLAEDPLFIDPDGADGVAGTDDDDGRLLSGSPCIDAAHNNAIAGLVETDLGGNPRFADDPATADTGCGAPVIVDMGAYEFQGRPVTVRPGDIDGDGVVGIRDFLALLERWGPCPSGCCLADLNLDGGVDIPDFQLLLENWSAVKSR